MLSHKEMLMLLFYCNVKIYYNAKHMMEDVSIFISMQCHFVVSFFYKVQFISRIY